MTRHAASPHRLRAASALAAVTVGIAIIPATNARATPPRANSDTATTCAKPLSPIITAYGDKIFRYDLPQSVISIPAPSATFEAATAPADRLRALGLPSSIGEASGAKNVGYRRMLGAMRKGDINPPVAPCVHHDRKNTATASNTLGSSSNWSGYLQQAPTGHNYEIADATITIPSQVNGVDCDRPTAISMWTGVGGWGSTAPLAQDGVDVSRDSNNVTTYSPFYELVSGGGDTGGEVDFPETIVAPVQLGQTREYMTFVDPGADGKSIAFFESVNPGMSNEVDNGATITPKTGGSLVYKQPTVDYIAERTEINGMFATYMDTTGVTFSKTQGEVSGTGWVGLSDSSADPLALTMTSIDQKTTLGYPTSFDNSGLFDANWVACGKVEAPPTQ